MIYATASRPGHRFFTYWWLLPLLIVAILFKSAWFKGFIGENGQCVCPVVSE